MLIWKIKSMSTEHSIEILILSFFVSRFLSYLAVRELSEVQKKLLFNEYSKHWALVIIVILTILGVFLLLQKYQVIALRVLFPGFMVLMTALTIVFCWISYKRMKPFDFPNNSAIKYILARASLFVGFAIVGIFGFQSV